MDLERFNALNVFHYLEFMNSFAATQAIIAFVVFLLYIWKHRADSYADVRPLIAMTTLWVGLALEQGLWWYTRHIEAEGTTVAVGSFIPVNFAGRLLICIGLACTLRIFMPNNWSHWVWISSILTAFVVASLSIIEHFVYPW
jgi:hypothetical protein